MTREGFKLVTIVAESVLQEQICRSLESLGATGYTVAEATGKGSRGMRVGELPGSNVRIETVVEPETSRAILALLERLYFPHYAIAAWVHDVAVVRGGKYSKKEREP
jgi:nitrogen regulatory protein PII